VAAGGLNIKRPATELLQVLFIRWPLRIQTRYLGRRQITVKLKVRLQRGRYLWAPPLLLDVLRPAEFRPVLPEAFLVPVLPLICEAFLAVTGMPERPFVVLADLRLLTFSLAILIYDTFFLTEVPFDAALAAFTPHSIS
jgi:hypothetical protein